MSVSAEKTQKGKIIIDESFCKGCGFCVEACPQQIINISGQISVRGYFPAQCPDPEYKCTGCTLCARVCPDLAIEVFSKLKKRLNGGKD